MDDSSNNTLNHDMVQITANMDGMRRSQRMKQSAQTLKDYEVYSDSQINDDGELVHMALLAEAEPVNCDEALQDPKWVTAMKEELNSIEKNGTWELVSLPYHKRPIAVKWVFKLKRNPNGEIIKHKARLVAKGFQQKEGIDYGEIFALVTRIETVRFMATVACSKNWSMHQLDAKLEFLNSLLEEEVYVD